MGVVYFLLGFVFWTVRGRALSELSVHFLATAAQVFVLGGVVTGAIVGVVQPHITSLSRSMAVFGVASVPLAIGIHWLFHDPFSGRQPISVAVLAAFGGLIGGTYYWNAENGIE